MGDKMKDNNLNDDGYVNVHDGGDCNDNNSGEEGKVISIRSVAFGSIDDESSMVVEPSPVKGDEVGHDGKRENGHHSLNFTEEEHNEALSSIRSSSQYPPGFVESNDKVREDDDDYTQDPIFRHLKSTGLLMKESRKREIFREAMRLYPNIQDEFNNEMLLNDSCVALGRKSSRSLSACIGCWQWRLRDGRVIWSPGMFRVCGRDPQLGTPKHEDIHLKFVDGAERDRYLKVMMPVMEGTADSVYYTMRMVRPGGQTYVASGVSLPVRDEKTGDIVKDNDGKVVEICGYLKDHGDYNAVAMDSEEEGSNSAGAALAAEEEVFFDCDGDIVDAPDSTAIATKTSNKTPKNDTTEMTNAKMKGRKSASAASMGSASENTEGDRIWDRATPRRLNSDGILPATALDRDMYLELARRERELHEKALVDKNNFIAYVFHEVRNPINAVYLGLQTLSEEMAEEHEKKSREGITKSEKEVEVSKLVELMRSSTERAMTILNDTLDYSKFELGTVHLNKKKMAISSCVEECVGEYKSQSQQQSISLNLEIKRDSIVDIDKTRIMQVMNNLMSNALKFTPSGGTIRVTVDYIVAASTERRSEVSVIDSGTGVKDEDIGRIFTPYNQIDNQVSGKKGMGIGLSISRKIANAHYGDLKLQSTYGQGSTFTLSLPAVERIVAEDATKGSNTPGKRTATTGCESSNQRADNQSLRRRRTPGELYGLNVLIVDDDRINKFMMKRMLIKRGCTVTLMGDGSEFLEHAREHPNGDVFDMIVLDDFMPNLDGSKAIRMARDEVGFKGFVVLCTGNMEDKSLQECGCNDILFKPLDFNLLKKIVEKNSL